MLTLLAALPATAEDFRKGLAAPKGSDYASIVEELRPLAEKGNARAQLALGLLYQQGRGVNRDVAAAVKWYLKAAEQGLAEAQFSLGNIYYKGKGVPRDAAKALKWFRKAADQGYPKAQYDLGIKYEYGLSVPIDYVFAYKWYNVAHASGYSSAGKILNKLAERMTPAQIAEGQKLAREWWMQHSEKKVMQKSDAGSPDLLQAP